MGQNCYNWALEQNSVFRWFQVHAPTSPHATFTKIFVFDNLESLGYWCKILATTRSTDHRPPSAQIVRTLRLCVISNDNNNFFSIPSGRMKRRGHRKEEKKLKKWLQRNVLELCLSRQNPKKLILHIAKQVSCN